MQDFVFKYFVIIFPILKFLRRYSNRGHGEHNKNVQDNSYSNFK